MEELPIASSRRQTVSVVKNRGADRIVKPIEMRVPQQAAWDCCETVYAEEGRRGLEQGRSQLLFTNETGRQNGDGDWSKRYNRKMHRVCPIPTEMGLEDEVIW
jgi:hypothetical protein